MGGIDMNIEQGFTLLAAQIKADAQELMQYAAEDTIGGYDINEANRKFPMGSLWEPEGKLLYALVRWLKPDVVAEIGGWVGCSASHLAAAVKANGRGRVMSVDSGEGGAVAGSLLLPEVRDYVTFVKADGRAWLAEQEDHSIGLLFEDADHSTELTAAIARLAVDKLEAGGVMVNHDAAHDFAIVGGGQRIGSSVGRAIRDGLAQAGVYFKPYLIEPSDCGVAVTVMPGVRTVATVNELTTPYDDGIKSQIEEARPIDGNSQTGYLELPPFDASQERVSYPVPDGKKEPTLINDTDVIDQLTKPVSKSRSKSRK
jgi:predicted O-methyltransferase YrrM